MLILFLISGSIFGQNIAITDDNGYVADTTAMLDVKSVTKGLLIPRLTSTQRNNIVNPATGLLVYDSVLNVFFYFNGSEWINISKGQVWDVNSEYVYLTSEANRVGIGTNSPNSKLEVRADNSFTENDTLFAVKDKDGNIVFAVFPDGAKVYVNTESKGTVGGFAVSGRSPTKATEEDYFKVTPDSTRVWINEDTTKGSVGGFAVSGRSPTKGIVNDYFISTADSTRIYVNDSVSAKGTVGGFAVSGRSPTKAGSTKFMDMTKENYFIGHQSGQKTTTGLYNAFLGYNAGYSNTEGSKNTFLGYEAGYNVTFGQDNVLLGYQAGYHVTTAGNNISIGSNAGFNNAVNSDNIFLGREAGFNHIGTGVPNEANNNIYLGFQAGYGAVAGESGVSNIYIGNKSGFLNTSGLYNVFLGSQAGYSNTTGANNVILGNDAGYGTTSGLNNVFLGNNAGSSNGDGSANVFIGNNAGFSLNSHVYNVMIGAGAGSDADGGDNNVFVGLEAGRFHVAGESNVILGNKAGLGDVSFSGITADRNVLIGTEAGRNINDAIDNVFIGHKAGEGILGNGGVTGDFNVMIGERAGMNIYSGSKNVFLGNEAGYSTDVGEGNIFVGFQCGYLNTTGSYNSFLGYEAGRANTSGENNMFMGYKAGELNIDGSNNMFIGTLAGSENTGGNSNLFIGDEAGSSNTTGGANMYIGSGAGKNAVDATYNMAIGMGAGRELTTGSYNVLIGQVAGDELTTGSNNIYIGTLVGSGNPNNQASKFNVYIGYNAAYYTKGSYNTYLGNMAGAGNNFTNDTTGSFNTFIGQSAGYSGRGNNNTSLGYSAGRGAIGSNNIYIGYDMRGQGTESNKLYIDNSNTSSPLIYGEMDNDLLRINGTLEIGTALDLNSNNIIDVGRIGLGTGATTPEEMVELAGASGDSPGILFRRGTTTDTYSDWKIENNGGYLRTYYRVNSTTWNHTTTIGPNTGYFGIGTTSPGANLHVVNTAGTTPTIGAGTIGVFQQNSGASNWSRVAIIGGTGGYSTLDFGDDGDVDIGGIRYRHTSNDMYLLTNGSVQMTIASDGDVTVNGEINNTATGAANMIPIAYGNISSTGGLNTSSGNVSINKSATGTYQVTITGESYFWTSYITNITILSGGALIANAGSSGGTIYIRIYNTSGTLTDAGFSFVTYKP